MPRCARKRQAFGAARSMPLGLWRVPTRRVWLVTCGHNISLGESVIHHVYQIIFRKNTLRSDALDSFSLQTRVESQHKRVKIKIK